MNPKVVKLMSQGKSISQAYRIARKERIPVEAKDDPDYFEHNVSKGRFV